MTTLPVARVCVDIPLPHLDRPFDYHVPDKWDEVAVVGARVRVRFAGRLVDGYVLDRVAESSHPGKLAPIARAVSAEAVVTPEIATLAREIADRNAGTLADVLRLAVPPRHAEAERAVPLPPAAPTPPAPTADPAAAPAADPASVTLSRVTGESEPAKVEHSAGEGWARYVHGFHFLDALRSGRSPRAVWEPLPGEDWPARIAEVCTSVTESGRGALVVVPDARDCERVTEALGKQLGSEQYVMLSAALGPRERYRRWLSVLRGHVRCVVGTRAAAFAPVHNLGVVAMWDDGDSSHVEPRAPYCHARETLLVRAQHTGAAALVAGFTRTPEAHLLVETGWAHPIVADRERVRAHAPRVVALDEAQRAVDGPARLPSVAYKAARDALAEGAPVLVQVARKGYAPTLCCVSCRRPARCQHCNGPLALPGSGQTGGCGWCGRPAADWACGSCGERRYRPSSVGIRRTTDELGRAFPGVPVYTSSAETSMHTVKAQPSVVVSTVGAEPIVEGASYGAALLLDAWSMLARPDLRAAQEAYRRWISAAALVRPASDGGVVFVTADASLPLVQALVRWDPAGFAAREYEERAELGFPPAVRMAKLTGSSSALAEFVGSVSLPDGAEVLGPVSLALPVSRTDSGDAEEEHEQYLVRVPRRSGLALARALAAEAGARSARKAGEAVRIDVDPYEI